MLRLKTLTLLCFWISLSMLEFVSAATSKDLTKQRQMNGFQECIAGWLDRINDHCIYPGQNTPCLVEDKDPNTSAAGDFADSCCKGRCNIRDLEKLCCRKKSCLNKCYSKVRTHKLRNTASLEKRTKFMFQKTSNFI